MQMKRLILFTLQYTYMRAGSRSWKVIFRLQQFVFCSSGEQWECWFCKVGLNLNCCCLS